MAAIDMIPGKYESQLEEKFVKLHDAVQTCVKKNFRDRGRLTQHLTMKLAQEMRSLNPVTSEDIEDSTFASEGDLEAGQQLVSQRGSYMEIELRAFATAIKRHMTVAQKDGQQLTWF